MNAVIETHAAARALIEKVLHKGADITADYPLVFGEDAPGKVITIEEEGVLHAACTILVILATQLRKVLMRREDYYDV